MTARIARIVSGRRSKWIVLGVWFLALFAASGANLPGKFSDAEKNESRSFLPGSAESTKALAVTEKLQKGDTAPTVVVFRREGGLTKADRALIARDRAKLDAVSRKYRNTSPFGPPEVSRDGTTALLRNLIKGTGEGKDIIDPVEDYRDAVSDPAAGWPSRSPARRATRPTPSRSSRGSTARC